MTQRPVSVKLLDKECIHVYTITMSIQYTIRKIPVAVDKALKQRAKITGKSFNQTVVDELQKNLQITDQAQDFSWLAGTMDEVDAIKFDEAIDFLNAPDPDFWQ